MEKLPSIKELKILIQPDPKKETVWYARIFIRKISIYLTWLLLQIKFTANEATFTQAFLGISGALLLALGGTKWAIVAIIIIQIGYIFDCIDGEIARYRQTTNVNGVFYDSTIHAIVIPFIFLGLTLYSYFLTNQIIVLFFGLILIIFSTNPIKRGMLSALFYLIERKDNPKYKYENFAQELNQAPTKPENDNNYIASTNKKMSIGQLIYLITKDISEYPTTMNIISLIVLVDLFIKHFTTWQIYSLPAILTIAYSIFFIIKEGIFFWKIARKRIVEKKFLEIIK